MSNQPIVSIISPTYNHAKYIADCINSALNQTYTNWEMIVVNDGSTDNTSDIVKSFVNKDNRIQLYDQENVGIFRLAETYNFALSKAQGNYIAILEGDDVWYPNKLEKQVKALEDDNSCVLAWGAAHQANADLSQKILVSPLVTDSMFQYFNNKPLGSMLDILFIRNCVPALTMLIRKETLIEMGGFKQGYGLPLVDLPTLQTLATKGFFYFDAEPLGSWRVYPGQTTKTYLTEMFEGFFSLTQDNYNTFSMDPSLDFKMSLKQIKKYFENTLITAYSRSGRYKLIKKQYVQARKDYIKSLQLPGDAYVWKLRSIVGLVMGFFHLDVEILAKLLGKTSYKIEENADK